MPLVNPYATTAGPGRPTTPVEGDARYLATLAELERLVRPHLAHGPDDGGGSDGDDAGDAGDDDGTGTDDAGDDGGDSTDTDPDQAARELARARAEAKRYRTRVRDLEAAEQARQREGLPELERAQTEAREAAERAERAEAALRERDLRDDVSELAKALGFHNPAKAMRHIDTDGLVDDDGKVDKAEARKRLADALKDEPYLGGAAAGGADGGKGRGRPAAGQSVNDTIRALARAKRAAG